MKREVAALRKRLWRDMTGCTCQKVITVDGKTLALNASEVCTATAIRCNGRMSCVQDAYRQHGLKLGPVMPGESGLVNAQECS